MKIFDNPITSRKKNREFFFCRKLGALLVSGELKVFVKLGECNAK
jgi:hypothetical protein